MSTQPADLALPEAVTLPLDQITPYPNNPRRIPSEAVDRVAQSIQAYGYTQPIVVDSDQVIVVGHTRYLALKQLGHTEATVYVTRLPVEKANEYRLVDNRTSEMTSWDHSALVSELREFESGLLNDFFPELADEISMIADATEQVTDEDVTQASDHIKKVKEADEVLTTTVVCPSCFHEFQVRADSLDDASPVT